MVALFVNQAAYAEHQKVSRKTVTLWKQKGYLVLNSAGRVNVAASDKRLVDAFGDRRRVLPPVRS